MTNGRPKNRERIPERSARALIGEAEWHELCNALGLIAIGKKELTDGRDNRK